MVELKIVKIDGYNYYLIDNNNNEYNFNIEFYDLEIMPKVNDKIYMNKILLREKLFCFGRLNGINGIKIKNALDEDIMVVKIDNELVYLKRYYG